MNDKVTPVPKTITIEVLTVLAPIVRQLEKVFASQQWQKLRIDTRPIPNGVALQVAFTIEDKIIIAKTLPFKEPN